MDTINKRSIKQKLKSYARSPLSLVFYLLVCLAILITAAVFLYIVGFILIKGVPHLKLSLFEWDYTTDNLSLMPALINTISMVFISLLIAAPLGIFSAIYLVEYAKRGSRLVKVIRVTSETLAGIPSIVYGLFGMLMFVTALKWGYSMLAGSLTMAIMVLPLIMRTTEEALIAVPDSYREGSFALGAGRLRTIFRIILPSAIPGILSGIILSIGRIVGETAALIYTSGAWPHIPKTVMDSGSTLAVHLWTLAREGLHVKEAYATAVVLLVIVFVINRLSNYAAKKLTKGTDNG